MSTNRMEYNDESISQLKGAQRIRTRPESMLGSKGLDGAKHTIFEIVGNSSDESLAGFGDALEIGLHEDGSISVRDYGRGVPLGWNAKEQNWNYYLIYEELYAGGKYGNSQDILRDIDERNAWDTFRLIDYPYLITVGLNGVGASATQCSSEYCTVTSYRDGVASTMEYRDGEHILDELRVEPTTEPNGTLVHWKPDPRVFTDVNIPASWLEKYCKDLSYTTGFNVTFNNKGKIKRFDKKSMEQEMMESTNTCIVNSKFSHTVDNEGDVCICFADVVLGAGGRGVEYFHNKVEIRGGVHSSALNTAQSTFFSEVAKERGIRINSSDYAGKISAIISTLSNKVSYQGQTKFSLDDYYVFNCIEECVYELLKREYAKGTQWLLDVVSAVIKNAENRIAVAELSKNLKEVEKAVKKGKVSDKFRTCRSYEDKKAAETEWWILEGDSAASSFAECRDSFFQCFLTIRGKSLNVYKSGIDKLIANKEIKDMIAILGTGIDLGIEGYASFDINKLRVGKIIFGTDADIDGKHIRMLLLLIFYILFPELLYGGYVYYAETPLHIVNLKDDSVIYCYSDEELAQVRDEVGQANIREVTRFKGLGEVNPDQLWETTVNPETRKLVPIVLERNDVEVADVIEVLFGKSTDRRKQAILGSLLGTAYDDLKDSIEDTLAYIEDLDLANLDVHEVLYSA